MHFSAVIRILTMLSMVCAAYFISAAPVLAADFNRDAIKAEWVDAGHIKVTDINLSAEDGDGNRFNLTDPKGTYYDKFAYDQTLEFKIEHDDSCVDDSNIKIIERTSIATNATLKLSQREPISGKCRFLEGEIDIAKTENSTIGFS